MFAGKLNVSVLDAAAIGISVVTGDFSTAGSTMFLLRVGDAPEDYIKVRPQHELIYSLLNIPEQASWLEGNSKEIVSSSDLAIGDVAVASYRNACMCRWCCEKHSPG